jgi:charged multivesicular body protein 5
MKRVFGKKKAKGPPPPTLGEASENVGKRSDNIEVKINSLDKELNGYKQKINTTKNPTAKRNLQKRAMEVLKRKRMYENQRDMLMGQQFNMDQAAFGIESAKATVDSVAAMKVASVELKKAIKKDLNVDDIDDLVDEMADMMEDMNEINEAMGRNFATPDDIDEAELEAELDMLEDELEEQNLEGVATPSYLQDDVLPENPTGVPQNKESATPAGL